MDAVTWTRWFGWQTAFDDPATVGLVSAIGGVLAVAGVAIGLLARSGKLSEETREELVQRWGSWCVITVLLVGPILAGAFWTILLALVLGLACYREFARTTGLFREQRISWLVVLSTLALAFASLDNYSRLYLACGPLGVALVVAGTIGTDRPSGFVQRTALGLFGFLLCCFSLGYLGQIAAAPNYRPILLLLLVAVSLNDVFAYLCGKLVGGPKWLPNTSPGKTYAGAVGALVLTTAFVAGVGRFVFAGSPLDHWGRLLTLGLVVSGLGQLGDLVLSSIKRDVGVKDVGRLIPGHGGLLDRFDSLVLVPPAVYHYLALYLGPLGGDQPVRVLTGGG